MLKVIFSLHSKSNQTYLSMSKLFRKPEKAMGTKIYNPGLRKRYLKSHQKYLIATPPVVRVLKILREVFEKVLSTKRFCLLRQTYRNENKKLLEIN